MTISVWAPTEAVGSELKMHRRHDPVLRKELARQVMRCRIKTLRIPGTKSMFDGLNLKAQLADANLRSKIKALTEEITELSAILRTLVVKCPNPKARACVGIVHHDHLTNGTSGISVELRNSGDVCRESEACRPPPPCRGTMAMTSKEGSETLETRGTLEGPSKLCGSRFECLFMDNDPDQNAENGDLLDTSGEESLTIFESVHTSGLTKKGDKEELGTMHFPKKKKAKSPRRAMTSTCSLDKNMKPSRVHSARNQHEEATSAAPCCPLVNLLDVPSHLASSSLSSTQSPRIMRMNYKEETARALVMSEIKDEIEASKHGNWGERSSDYPAMRGAGGRASKGEGEPNTGVGRREPEAVDHELGIGPGFPLRKNARGRQGKQASGPLTTPGANGAPDLLQETQGE